MRRTRDPELPETILFDIESYLKSRGWKKGVGKNEKLAIYENDIRKLQGIKIILPSSMRYSDSDRRVESVIDTLATIEGVSLSVFRDSLLAFNKDAVLFRIFSAEGSDSLPISHVQDQISGIKKLIMYAASSVTEQIRFHATPTPLANSFIKSCEFGHTFRGSFGFSVYLRVSDRNQTSDLIDPPIARRIVERIGLGTASIEEAVHNRDAGPIVESYSAGLNSRMCDALVEISAEGEYEYSLGINWAIAIPPDERFKALQPIVIGSQAVELLSVASSQLKLIKPHETTIAAYVSNLHCVRDPKDDEARRKIEMRFDHSEFGRIEVAVSLGTDEYFSAVEAHRDRRRLSVTGKLQRIGSAWSIIEVSDFRVLDGDKSSDLTER